MSKNEFMILKELDIKDFSQRFESIKNIIFLKNSIFTDINEKDLKIFIFIIKNFGLRKIYNFRYISKINTNFIISQKLSKKFFINQISLLYILLYCKNKSPKIKTEEDTIIYETYLKNIYKNIFNIIDNIYISKTNDNTNNNLFLDICDIFQLIRLNLLLGLDKLLDKSYIFNESIHYLNKIYFLNENNEKIQPYLKLIMTQIYSNLCNSEKNLYFLKRDKNLDNFAILEITNFLFSTKIDNNLIGLIMEILNLIYKNNYSNFISDYILNKIKEGFYELKQNNMKNILRSIKNIYGLTSFLINLFNGEENEKDDPYKPSSYFVFGGNEQSGINYNPNNELLKKNFTLIFSFKIDKIIDDTIYPLISFINFGGVNEIIFNLSIQNKKLQFYCQGDKKFKEIAEVYSNTSYLVVLEYKSSGILKDKIKININDKKYEISFSNINTKDKCKIKIGYLTKNNLSENDKIFQNSKNFKGIIGPIIQYSNIFDDKNFVSNIMKLKGKYDIILLINKNINLDYNYIYEGSQYFLDEEIVKAIKYFSEFSYKINEYFQYSICPLSIINNISKNTYFFPQDIYNKSSKNNDKDFFIDFNTLAIPNSKSLATYAKKDQKSLSIFVEYDGIFIYTLIVEYFYNILRMLINNLRDEKIDLVDEIYEVLSLIFKGIFKILKFFNLEHFSDSIDTLGFSIKKLFGLLFDIKPLNESLINVIVVTGKQLISYSNEYVLIKSRKIIINFLSKLVILIVSPKCLNVIDFYNSKLLFEFVNSLMKINVNLINEDSIKELLSFSFILDQFSFDKYYNNPSGTTLNSNDEYKKMKKEYKNLIITFIQNSPNLKIYSAYLMNSFYNNESSWTEKYKLIKIYYQFNKVQILYNEQKNNDSNNGKNNNYSEKELLNDYQKYFSQLIEKSNSDYQESETPFELLKTLFILLIHELKIIIPLTIYKENNESNHKIKRTEKKSSTIKVIKNTDNPIEKITFFNNLSLSSKSLEAKLGKKEEIEKISDKLCSNHSLEEIDFSNISSENKENKINYKENYLFDILLDSKNFSFFIIKGVLTCLCDNLDKKNKIKFIKNEDDNIEKIKDYITKYDRYKKKLSSQFLGLVQCIGEEKVLQQSLKLIFEFLNKSVHKYIEDFSNKKTRTLFLHLFESKSMLNNFVHYCLNTEILKDKKFKNYIVGSIKFINKTLILHHPRPYIFSFIKYSIKNENSETFLIIDNICSTIIENLKLKNHKSIYIFEQNLIHFISILLKVSEKYSNNLQNLLIKNNLELFYCLQNFVNELTKTDIIYYSFLYVKTSFFNIHSKEDKKNDIIINSSKTKLLNNQIILLNLFQIGLNCVYLLWKSQERVKKAINVSLEYISKIHFQIICNGNFISYFLDIANPYSRIKDKYLAKKIPEKIKTIANKDINNNSRNKNIPYLRETKIISFCLFLMIMKYQSLLINYERSKNKGINEENVIRKAFEPHINRSEKEIIFLVPKTKIIKDNNLDTIIEKEEAKSKDFKNFNKNYYDYFSEKLKQENFDIVNIKEEIENKFIEDENKKIEESLNLLKNEENSTNLNDSKSERKEKNRKDSFGEYSDDNEILKEEKNKRIKINEEIKKEKTEKIMDENRVNPLDFEDSKYPILCTKRDLVLKNFGYFYYKYYFKNNKFIKLKQKFFYENNPNDNYNNYYGFQKIMKNKYPFTLKNFSNNDLYYPRVFYKPYHKFFENKYFPITHPYFDNQKYDKTNKEKIMHLEYGHGLLNQFNFELYSITNKNKSKDKIINNKVKEEEKIENIMTPFTDDTFNKKNNNNNNFFIKRNMTLNPEGLDSNLNDLKLPKNNEVNQILKFECEKISHKNNHNGFLYISNYFLIYQVNTNFKIKEYRNNPAYLLSGSEYEKNQEEKQVIIPYKSIYQILYRKFLFYDVAIEFFLKNGKSYYFNFYTNHNKNEFMKILSEKIEEDIIIKNSIEYFEKKKFSNKWLDGSISTLDYLLLINKFSDRTYNDLSQYLILPWLLNNYEDIYNVDNIRNFNFPSIFKSKKELDSIIREDTLDGYKSHFSNFCSNYMYVNHYLFRTYPYINNQIRLQDDCLDNPDRQFKSFLSTFDIFKENPKIFLELIPEIFFIPEIFMNLNCCNYGKIKKEGKSYLLNNLGIGPWFHQILEMINYHKYNLDSENIISQINKWIDIIFGENQISSKYDNVSNYPKECYETFVKEDVEKECEEINIHKATENIKNLFYRSYTYGFCPTKIFTKSHQAFSRKIEPKIYNFSNINNFHTILKNDRIKLDKTDILYLQESSNGNYFYVVCEHEILVFHKNLKKSNHLTINYISKFPDSFEIKYHMNNSYLKLFYNYKYLIFDIFDCKCFFVGGYMDNSLRIYLKNNDNDIMYSIYVESQIKCLKNNSDDQTFYTGHENGKIIKWKYQFNNDNNQISIKKDVSIRGHKSSVKMIEVNKKYECIISIDNDEIIFIRKLYDFELLSHIKINKHNKKVIDINIYEQIIILTIWKLKTDEIFLYTYTLNGLNLSKAREPLKLPITLIPNTDEIIIFRKGNIYLAKVAFNEKTSLLAISNNLEVPNIDLSLKDDNDNDDAFNFNKDLQENEAISYFYDSKNKVLFCLFSNGMLYRVNFVKNA